MIKHVVSLSGGIASAEAAFRVVERHGKANVVLLFADTMMEDEDLYRFLAETSAAMGVSVTRIADGRNPWEVFNDERFLGNSRIDPCSKILKRELLGRWMRDNAPTATMQVGMWSDEQHRLVRLRVRRPEITWDSPLIWEPWATQRAANLRLDSLGIKPPRLYAMGFLHNNCGGFCIKAGQAQFANLYREMPARYRFHEAQEQAIREKLGDVTILTEQRNGVERKLSLKVLRERIESQCEIDWNDTRSGCGCAIVDEEPNP